MERYYVQGSPSLQRLRHKPAVAYHFIFFQFPGTGNFRQLAGVNFNLTGRRFKWICLGVVTKCFVGDKMTIGIFTLIDTHFF
ncbi:hypothetical protein CMV48_15285 [Escherichia coli]|nr:hypothetical protein CMV48_15285 [Escherichia coli]